MCITFPSAHHDGWPLHKLLPEESKVSNIYADVPRRHICPIPLVSSHIWTSSFFFFPHSLWYISQIRITILKSVYSTSTSSSHLCTSWQHFLILLRMLFAHSCGKVCTLVCCLVLPPKKTSRHLFTVEVITCKWDKPVIITCQPCASSVSVTRYFFGTFVKMTCHSNVYCLHVIDEDWLIDWTVQNSQAELARVDVPRKSLGEKQYCTCVAIYVTVMCWSYFHRWALLNTKSYLPKIIHRDLIHENKGVFACHITYCMWSAGWANTSFIKTALGNGMVQWTQKNADNCSIYCTWCFIQWQSCFLNEGEMWNDHHDCITLFVSQRTYEIFQSFLNRLYLMLLSNLAYLCKLQALAGNPLCSAVYANCSEKYTLKDDSRNAPTRLRHTCVLASFLSFLY